MRLGRRVRNLRKRKKWTLEELAHRAGMHVTYLSSIEHGQRNPTLNILGAISQAFGISMAALFRDISENS